MGKKPCKTHGDHTFPGDKKAAAFKRGSEFLQFLERAGLAIEATQGPHFAMSVASVLDMLAHTAPCEDSARGLRLLIDQLVAPWDDVTVNGVSVGTTIRETIAAGYDDAIVPTIPIPEMVPVSSVPPGVVVMAGSPFGVPAQTDN